MRAVRKSLRAEAACQRRVELHDFLHQLRPVRGARGGEARRVLSRFGRLGKGPQQAMRPVGQGRNRLRHPRGPRGLQRLFLRQGGAPGAGGALHLHGRKCRIRAGCAALGPAGRHRRTLRHEPRQQAPCLLQTAQLTQPLGLLPHLGHEAGEVLTPLDASLDILEERRGRPSTRSRALAAWRPAP